MLSIFETLGQKWHQNCFRMNYLLIFVSTPPHLCLTHPLILNFFPAPPPPPQLKSPYPLPPVPFVIRGFKLWSANVKCKYYIIQAIELAWLSTNEMTMCFELADNTLIPPCFHEILHSRK